MKMSWSNASIPYFTLKYLLPLEDLLVSSYGPMFIDRCLQTQGYNVWKAAYKVAPNDSWYSEAGYVTPLHTKQMQFLDPTGYCTNDKSLTSKARSLKTLWHPSWSLLSHSHRVRPRTMTSRTVASRQPESTWKQIFMSSDDCSPDNILTAVS